MLYNTSVFLCLENILLGKIPRSCRAGTLLSSCYNWLESRNERAGIHQHGNNVRSYHLCFPEQNLTCFLTSPQPAAQPSFQWAAEKAPSHNHQQKLPATRERYRFKHENLPSVSLHPFSDLSRNFQVRF